MGKYLNTARWLEEGRVEQKSLEMKDNKEVIDKKRHWRKQIGGRS